MPASPEQAVREVGKRLAQPRLGKDALVKLLKASSVASLVSSCLNRSKSTALPFPVERCFDFRAFELVRGVLCCQLERYLLHVLVISQLEIRGALQPLYMWLPLPML